MRSIKVISCIQIIGGIIGILLCAIFLWMRNFSIINTLLTLAVGLMYAISIYYGVQLKKNRHSGWLFSSVWFAAQIPIISSEWIKYFFSSGAYIKMIFGPAFEINFDITPLVSNFYLEIGRDSGFSFSINSIGVYFSGINLLGLASFFFLWRAKGKLHVASEGNIADIAE
uniref:hypothetical protein n=1 Tax=Candidatus Electronema sp. TaxID=2698783 RepID=UPI00405771FA